MSIYHLNQTIWLSACYYGDLTPLYVVYTLTTVTPDDIHEQET